MNIKEVERLGRSVRYPFYSIFKAVQERPQGGLSIQLRRDRPSETRQSGIYVWHHPDWGYFYVGIAAADNFTERWNKHIQKLLDQCTSAKQMKNWQTFARLFAQQGYGINDLKDVTLRFFPRPNPNSPTFKKELENIETRIVGIINPMCNKEYNPDRPSSTRVPPPRTPIQESSGYSLEGSFTHDLTTSKVWLLQELARIAPKVGTVYILGSWFGNLSLYMHLMPMIKHGKVINVETDQTMLDQSARMLDLVGAKDVEHMNKDANKVDYRQLGNNGVVINCSLTDMPGRDWYEHIPPGTLVVLQARDHDPGAKFASEDDIVKKFPLDVMYKRSMDLEDPETQYKRFMVIGTKPNTP